VQHYKAVADTRLCEKVVRSRESDQSCLLIEQNRIENSPLRALDVNPQQFNRFIRAPARRILHKLAVFARDVPVVLPSVRPRELSVELCAIAEAAGDCHEPSIIAAKA
jgi:hypothetical protein